ncbi:NAD-dependent epimerase/dehydratase family protein [Leifsonia sp. NPDC056665]|uniref:NAD-dependent epimerase/dehydratase family protein n=1 Tax=Leifsonia sp. NPDC056665 TaxID=3345901 RepID=UPI00368B8CAA
MNIDTPRVLVTGASGYIGSRLVTHLADRGCAVTTLGRTAVDSPAENIVGSFANPDDLVQLRDHSFDVVVHLAGVTGEANEDDAFRVNVDGTRHFLRYLIDHGTRRFVIASSIAAAGCLTQDFWPIAVPIPSDHPCESVNVYGVSKYFIEEMSRYFARSDAALEFDLFRIGVVVADDDYKAILDEVVLPFTQLGTVPVSKVLDQFTDAVVRPLRPGVRVANLVDTAIPSPVPTIETLHRVLGERVNELDLAFYRRPENEFAALWASDGERA